MQIFYSSGFHFRSEIHTSSQSWFNTLLIAIFVNFLRQRAEFLEIGYLVLLLSRPVNYFIFYLTQMPRRQPPPPPPPNLIISYVDDA